MRKTKASALFMSKNIIGGIDLRQRSPICLVEEKFGTEAIILHDLTRNAEYGMWVPKRREEIEVEVGRAFGSFDKIVMYMSARRFPVNWIDVKDFPTEKMVFVSSDEEPRARTILKEAGQEDARLIRGDMNGFRTMFDAWNDWLRTGEIGEIDFV